MWSHKCYVLSIGNLFCWFAIFKNVKVFYFQQDPKFLERKHFLLLISVCPPNTWHNLRKNRRKWILIIITLYSFRSQIFMEHWPYGWAVFKALWTQQQINDAFYGMYDLSTHWFKDLTEHWLDTRYCALSKNIKAKIQSISYLKKLLVQLDKWIIVLQCCDRDKHRGSGSTSDGPQFTSGQRAIQKCFLEDVMLTLTYKVLDCFAGGETNIREGGGGGSGNWEWRVSQSRPKGMCKIKYWGHIRD